MSEEVKKALLWSAFGVAMAVVSIASLWFGFLHG